MKKKIMFSKDSNSELELEKLNTRQFLFFCKHIQPILENYTLIYELIAEKANVTTTFSNEKEFLKSIQSKAFRLMLAQARGGCGAFDLEVLSLNMLNNAVLSLRQFGALRRTAGSQASFEIDHTRLSALHRKLKYVLSVTRSKMNELVKLVRSIDQNNERDFSFVESSSLEQGAEFIAEYQEIFIKPNSAKI